VLGSFLPVVLAALTVTICGHTAHLLLPVSAGSVKSIFLDDEPIELSTPDELRTAVANAVEGRQ